MEKVWICLGLIVLAVVIVAFVVKIIKLYVNLRNKRSDGIIWRSIVINYGRKVSVYFADCNLSDCDVVADKIDFSAPKTGRAANTNFVRTETCLIPVSKSLKKAMKRATVLGYHPATQFETLVFIASIDLIGIQVVVPIIIAEKNSPDKVVVFDLLASGEKELHLYNAASIKGIKRDFALFVKR